MLFCEEPLRFRWTKRRKRELSVAETLSHAVKETQKSFYDQSYRSFTAFLNKSAIYGTGLLPLGSLHRSLDNILSRQKRYLNSASEMAFLPISGAMVANSLMGLANPVASSLNALMLEKIALQFDYVREMTKEYSEPELDVAYTTIWENDLVRLNKCGDNNYPQPKDKGDLSFVLFLPIMRGPFLAFYTEKGRKEKIKSVGKALIASNAGNIFFTDWKNPSGRSLGATIDDYIETYHLINNAVAGEAGEPPINIDLCQPGYFDMIRLSRYPDDALMAVLVASPHSTIDEGSITYSSVMNYSRHDLEMMVAKCGGKFPGKMIAESWGLANMDLLAERLFHEPFEIYIAKLDGSYDPERRDTFNSWMYHDTRDVAGPAILGIYDIFREELMLKEPYASAQSNYKSPLIVVIGDKDDIVTPAMARSVFDYAGTPERWKREFIVKGGHAGVFNGSAAFRKKSSDYSDWMDDIIPCIRHLASDKRRLEIDQGTRRVH